MKVVNVGYNYRHSPDFYIDRPYGSGDYMMLVIKTEAFVLLRGERAEVYPNSIIIFKKGTPQLYGAKGGEYVNDWLHFELDRGEEAAITELGVLFDTVIHLNDSTEFSDFIKSIFTERYSANLHKSETMQRYFDLIILKLSEKISKQSNDNEHPYYNLFRTIRDEIRLEPQRDWSIDTICKKVNLSRSYLQHLYKTFFGTNIISDIKSCRMEYAKYLLISTNMTVASISSSCGYKSDVHFMRLFKNTFGLPPSEFRERHRISTSEVRKSKQGTPFSLA